MQTFDINSSRIQKRLIANNHLAFAFLTHMPILPGHTLVCPLRQVANSDDLTHQEWHSILLLKTQICIALKKSLGAQGFNFAWNQAEVAGQTVPHFHLHIVPRSSGDNGIIEYEPRKFLYRTGSRSITPMEELENTALLIKNNLNN